MKCPDCQGEVMEIRGGYYCTKCGNKVDLEQIKLQLEAKVAQAKEKAQEQLGKVDDSANMFASKYEDLPQPPLPTENQFSETNLTQGVEGDNPQNIVSDQESAQPITSSEQNIQQAEEIANPLPASQEFNQTPEEVVADNPTESNSANSQTVESMPEIPQPENQSETQVPEPPSPEVMAESPSVAQNMSPKPDNIPVNNIPSDDPPVSSVSQVDSPEPPAPVSANIPQADLSQAKVEMPLNQKNHLLGSLKAKILLIAVIIINILIMGAIIYFLVLKND